MDHSIPHYIVKTLTFNLNLNLYIYIYTYICIHIYCMHCKATHLHEYGHCDQSVGALGCLCVVGIKLMIVVDQLNLEDRQR